MNMQNNPKTLYHYCEINNLTLSNLVKKEIHFTPSTQTNDRKDCWIPLNESNNTKDHENIISEIRRRIYLACFSEDGENDAMRAYYAKNSHGMIIKFEGLDFYSSHENLRFFKVNYKETISDEEVNLLLKTCDNFLKDKKKEKGISQETYNEMFNLLLHENLGILEKIASIKDKCWIGEKEIRYVYFRKDWKESFLKYKKDTKVTIAVDDRQLNEALNSLIQKNK